MECLSRNQATAFFMLILVMIWIATLASALDVVHAIRLCNKHSRKCPECEKEDKGQ